MQQKISTTFAILGRVPYTVVISADGSGASRYGTIAINRSRNDATRGDYGQWCYLREVGSGRIWSATHRPVCAPASTYDVVIANDRVTFHRRDGDIETLTEVVVVPGENAEARRVTVTNHSGVEATVELTSYQEVVLAPYVNDRGHRAFSNLFVQTEWLPETQSILAMRRPRSAKDKPAWCGHTIATSQDSNGSISCDTDRASFVGRGRSARNPAAMDNSGELACGVGAVLDPVFALRTALHVAPGQSAQVIFTTFFADDRHEAMSRAGDFCVMSNAIEAFSSSSGDAERELSDIGITAADARLYQDAAGVLLRGAPLPGPLGNTGIGLPPGRAELVAIGISGDLPLILAKLNGSRGMAGALELLALHRYWRLKGIACDLAILCDDKQNGGVIAADVLAMVATLGEASLLDQPGGVFVREADALAVAELDVLESVAVLRADCSAGTLKEWLGVDSDVVASGAASKGDRDYRIGKNAASELVVDDDGNDGRARDLDCFNGLGGFNTLGEYEIRLSDGQLPPAPWINVIANPAAGFFVSESGAGPTWAVNSSFFRLSAWANDPVQDPPGECIYLKDESTGDVWTPTPAPVRETTPYVTRHGAGYSVFEHTHGEIATSLRVGMPEADPVKIQVLTIANNGTRPRRITMTSYVDWVLGFDRERTQGHVRTELARGESLMLASNTFEHEFAEQVAFSCVSEPLSGATADRTRFIGRDGTMSSPSALAHSSIDGTTELVADACAALQVSLELAAGETRDITILLGSAHGRENALALAEQYRDPRAATAALDTSAEAWRNRLGTIRVKTPEPTFDLMLNQWSLYQAISCRMWGRIALYQSSGAFGFRDQLQDAMALVYSEPALARAHILHASSRQFEAGDVQHWWHPHSGRGVRTRFADDLIWLPYVVNHYLRTVGDTLVLDELTPYVTSRQLQPDEDELYDVPDISQREESVYGHCVLALRRACTVGAHGLPLIGGGDWNDGMNRVGIEGKGESVWLAWFLITTLREFATHCTARNDNSVAEEFLEIARLYNDAIESTSWDGSWYRRAYYDDGAPLGARGNTECEIDSIAQSWSVISRAGDPDRAREAMQSLDERLVRDDARLLMLLTPAFNEGTHDPGYIRGYLPGVRENGAQYTHAAMWAVLATAMLGKGDRAFELFQMTNPITHALSPEAVDTYKVEPYVVAADVYTAEGHLGRGGWTWYTGSASWLYRVGLEAIIGFTKLGTTLALDPCIPAAWSGFQIEYRYGATMYSITVKNPDGVERGVVSTIVDGVEAGTGIELVDDGRRREVVVTLGVQL